MWLAGHGWEKDGEARLPVDPTGTLGVVAVEAVKRDLRPACKGKRPFA
jgi:hypothetical protein